MDIPVEKKRFSTKRIISFIGLIAIIALLYLAYNSSSGKSRLNVQKERLTISTVSKATFKETIPINGIVFPVSTIYLDALEGGRVEELYVEDGAVMKKGQPILRLSNTDLELSLANQEVAVFNVLTQMQNTKNIAEQNSMNRQNQMADAENEYVEAKRVYDLNTELYEGGAIGSQDLESSKNLYNYQKKRLELSEDMMQQDKESLGQQIEQASESYKRMSNTLKLMRRKVDDLVVKSPIDGKLTSLDAEIGQSINKGERLGQIDNMSGYKVRAEIDEHYIARIFAGQKADYTAQGKSYLLEIKKVYTQVVGGRFQVDMLFEDEVPGNIRRGQSLQLRVALSDETQALLVPKGGFYQKTGGNWVFKIDEQNNIAYRKDIRIGRQSPEHYELLSGLEPGDKIITSSYDLFGDNEELVLK